MSVPFGSTTLPVHRPRREQAAALVAWIGSGLTVGLIALGVRPRTIL